MKRHSPQVFVTLFYLLLCVCLQYIVSRVYYFIKNGSWSPRILPVKHATSVLTWINVMPWAVGDAWAVAHSGGGSLPHGHQWPTDPNTGYNWKYCLDLNWTTIHPFIIDQKVKYLWKKGLWFNLEHYLLWTLNLLFNRKKTWLQFSKTWLQFSKTRRMSYWFKFFHSVKRCFYTKFWLCRNSVHFAECKRFSMTFVFYRSYLPVNNVSVCHPKSINKYPTQISSTYMDTHRI